MAAHDEPKFWEGLGQLAIFFDRLVRHGHQAEVKFGLYGRRLQFVSHFGDNAGELLDHLVLVDDAAQVLRRFRTENSEDGDGMGCRGPDDMDRRHFPCVDQSPLKLRVVKGEVQIEPLESRFVHPGFEVRL
ncbi:hypothetical protein D3C72_1463490 [compost metagenome]